MDQHNEVEIVISDHCDSEWDSDDDKQTCDEVTNSILSISSSCKQKASAFESIVFFPTKRANVFEQ